MFLECCCQNVDDARKAEAGGASRIELCEQLPLDGLTPSDENILMTLATVSIPVNVLVRCRAGNFVYTDEEIDTMACDIERICRLIAKASDGNERRVNAVVIGALTTEGDVDIRAMRRLLDAAVMRPVTFHRAFDVCRDPLQAYDDISALGICRILTSGHAPSAWEGRELLAELVRKSQSAGPVVLVGGGVRPHNIDVLAEATKAIEFHSSCLLGWENSLELKV
jgi:copper homeostasis protein